MSNFRTKNHEGIESKASLNYSSCPSYAKLCQGTLLAMLETRATSERKPFSAFANSCKKGDGRSETVVRIAGRPFKLQKMVHVDQG